MARSNKMRGPRQSRSLMKVSADVRPIALALREMERQIPYATKEALNLTAKAAWEYVRAHIGDDFTIRNKGKHGLAGGIKREFATKESLTAAVGSQDDFMRLQVFGGDKPGSLVAGPGGVAMGGRLVGVPILGGPARPAASKKITSKTLPTAIAESLGGRIDKSRSKRAARIAEGKRVQAQKGPGKPFIAPLRSGSDTLALYRRKTRDRMPLEAIYVFKTSSNAQYKKRWPLEPQVAKVVKAEFPTHVAKAIEKTVRTAKRKTGA